MITAGGGGGRGAGRRGARTRLRNSFFVQGEVCDDHDGGEEEEGGDYAGGDDATFHHSLEILGCRSRSCLVKRRGFGAGVVWWGVCLFFCASTSTGR